MNMQHWMKALLISGTLVSMVGTVSAHVTVWPKQSTVGEEEKYTVRVPDEKGVNNVKIRLVFPAGEELDSVEPVSGWTYSTEKDSSGKVTALDWTATAVGGIKPDEFGEFSFIGVNPKTPGDIQWKAYQMFADGSSTEWTGAPNSDTPSPVTTITATPAARTAPSTQPTNLPNQQTQQASTAQPATSSSNNTLPLVLSGLALLLALISLFRKRA